MSWAPIKLHTPLGSVKRIKYRLSQHKANSTGTESSKKLHYKPVIIKTVELCVLIVFEQGLVNIFERGEQNNCVRNLGHQRGTIASVQERELRCSSLTLAFFETIFYATV